MQSGFIPFIRKGKIEPVLDGLLVTRQSPKEQGWLGFFWGGGGVVCFFLPWRGENEKKFWSLKNGEKGRKLISPYDFNNV